MKSKRIPIEDKNKLRDEVMIDLHENRGLTYKECVSVILHTLKHARQKKKESQR